MLIRSFCRLHHLLQSRYLDRKMVGLLGVPSVPEEGRRTIASGDEWCWSVLLLHIDWHCYQKCCWYGSMKHGLERMRLKIASKVTRLVQTLVVSRPCVTFFDPVLSTANFFRNQWTRVQRLQNSPYIDDVGSKTITITRGLLEGIQRGKQHPFLFRICISVFTSFPFWVRHIEPFTLTTLTYDLSVKLLVSCRKMGWVSRVLSFPPLSCQIAVQDCFRMDKQTVNEPLASLTRF